MRLIIINILALLTPLLTLFDCSGGMRTLDRSSIEDEREITLYFDWHQLSERPTGMTVLFYPEDGGEPYKFVSNVVDSITVKLPHQNYEMLVFNQTVEEYRSLAFRNLTDFALAEMYIPDDGTRAFNSKTRLQPNSSATKSTTIPKTTRALIERAKFYIEPENRIYDMDVTVYVRGIQFMRSVEGSMDGLASGFKLNREALVDEQMTQILEGWDIQQPNSEGVGNIHINFGTLGIPYLTDSESGNAANVNLDLTFTLTNGEQVHFSFNVTKYIQVHEGGTGIYIDLYLGTNEEDNIPPLELSPSEGAFKVESWGEEKNHEIKL